MSHSIPTNTIDVLEIAALAGDLVTATCRSAYPPGARVRFAVHATAATAPLWVSGKITSVKSATGGQYELCVRLHNLTAEHRTALMSACEAH